MGAAGRETSSVIIAPAQLPDSRRAEWILDAFQERLRDMTNIRRGGGPVQHEIARLRPYFHALNEIVRDSIGEKIDSQWLFETLLHRKRSLWTSVFQGIESVFPLCDPRFTHGHIEGIEIDYRDSAGERKKLKFGSVKRFTDSGKNGGDRYEMFQCLVSVPFQVSAGEGDRQHQVTYNGRYPVVMFDRRICRELDRYDALKMRDMPRLLMLAGTIFTLASHDWVHGTAVPWRDYPGRPMPAAFDGWQHEILGGSPLLWQQVLQKPEMGWPMNYEIMSQRATYEVMNRLRPEGVARIVEAFLREVDLFKNVSGDAQAGPMALHLVRNVSRFAAHIMPYETLEPLLEKHGYKFSRTHFCSAVQDNAQIPLAASTDPEIGYVYSVNDVVSQFNARTVAADLEDGGGWKQRIAGQRKNDGHPVSDPGKVGTVGDIVAGFYRTALRVFAPDFRP